MSLCSMMVWSVLSSWAWKQIRTIRTTSSAVCTDIYALPRYIARKLYIELQSCVANVNSAGPGDVVCGWDERGHRSQQCYSVALHSDSFQGRVLSVR